MFLLSRTHIPADQHRYFEIVYDLDNEIMTNYKSPHVFVRSAGIYQSPFLIVFQLWSNYLLTRGKLRFLSSYCSSG